MNKTENKRIGYLDFLRIISAFAVVIIHVVGSVGKNTGLSPDSITAYALDIIHNLMNWSVPIFFMITGYLWLGQDTECTYNKVSKNITKFLLILASVGTSYAFLERIFSNENIGVKTILYSIVDVLQGKLWDHMWYVYAIIGIYLILPIVKPFFDKDIKTILIADLILFIFLIILPSVKEFLHYSFPITIPFSGYIFHCFTGATIAKLQFSKKHTAPAVIAMVASSVCITLALVLGLTEKFGYKTILIYILSTSIFILAKILLENFKPNKLTVSVAQCSWGIYLIHPLFINILIKLLRFNPLKISAPISIPLTCILIFVLSYLTIYLLRKIPFVRKYFL